MSIGSRFVHSLAIERATASGTADDYNHQPSSYAVLATVRGLIQPKRAEEMAQLNQAGAVVSDHTVYLSPTDVREADRIRFEPADGRYYEVRGVRDAAGLGHHLEIEARMVTA